MAASAPLGSAAASAALASTRTRCFPGTSTEPRLRRRSSTTSTPSRVSANGRVSSLRRRAPRRRASARARGAARRRARPRVGGARRRAVGAAVLEERARPLEGLHRVDPLERRMGGREDRRVLIFLGGPRVGLGPRRRRRRRVLFALLGLRLRRRDRGLRRRRLGFGGLGPCVGLGPRRRGRGRVLFALLGLRLRRRGSELRRLGFVPLGPRVLLRLGGVEPLLRRQLAGLGSVRLKLRPGVLDRVEERARGRWPLFGAAFGDAHGAPCVLRRRCDEAGARLGEHACDEKRRPAARGGRKKRAHRLAWPDRSTKFSG